MARVFLTSQKTIRKSSSVAKVYFHTQLKVAESLFSKIPWIDFLSISSVQEGLRVNFLLSPLASFQLELKDSSILDLSKR